MQASIVIYGDQNFTAEHGITRGSGTADDPYLIEGWENHCYPQAPEGGRIEVVGTRAHLTVRGLQTSACNNDWPIVRLSEVSNVTIESAFATAIRNGISIESSRNVTVLTSHFDNTSSSGIFVGSSRDVTIRDNSFSRNGGGVAISGSENITVVDNLISGSAFVDVGCYESSQLHLDGNRFPEASYFGNEGGVRLMDCGQSTISNNSFFDTGISLEGSHANEFENYTITPDNLVDGRPILFFHDCSDLTINGSLVGQVILINCKNVTLRNLGLSHTRPGVQMAFSHNVTLTRSSFSDIPVAVSSFESTQLLVYRNNFALAARTHDHPIYIVGGWSVRLDAGFPQGGNWWSEYDGQDTCTGIGQHQCSMADGLGDTPYQAGYDRLDKYPLMTPVNLTNVAPSPVVSVVPLRGNLSTYFSFNATGSSDREDSSAQLESRWDFQDDGTWDANWSRSPVAVHRYMETGNYTVRLEARDLDGWVNATTASVVVVAGPTETGPPSLRVNPPDLAPPGGGIAVTAHVEDPGGVALVTFYYRASWELAFHRVPMMPVGGGDYETSIQPQANGTQLQFYVVASDAWGNEARDPAQRPYEAVEIGPTPEGRPVEVWPYALAIALAMVAIAAVIYVREVRK